MHTTSFWECSERRISDRPTSFAWQVKQLSRILLGGSSLKATIVAFPPRASTCALPGPWQLSHPVCSGRRRTGRNRLVVRIFVEAGPDVGMTCLANCAANVLRDLAVREEFGAARFAPRPPSQGRYSS